MRLLRFGQRVINISALVEVDAFYTWLQDNSDLVTSITPAPALPAPAADPELSDIPF